MKILGYRIVSGKRLDKIIKEWNSINLERKDLYDEFFTKKEKQFLQKIYMTTYKRPNGQYYVRFTEHLPIPQGYFTLKKKDLIGKKTGYDTEIVSCENCYMIR